MFIRTHRVVSKIKKIRSPTKAVSFRYKHFNLQFFLACHLGGYIFKTKMVTMESSEQKAREHYGNGCFSSRPVSPQTYFLEIYYEAE